MNTNLHYYFSHCCVGLEPGEDAEEFYKEILPSATETFLILGRRLQTCFINAAKVCIYLVFCGQMILIFRVSVISVLTVTQKSALHLKIFQW